MNDLKIFFYWNNEKVATLVTCVMPVKGQKIKVTNCPTKGEYIVDDITWELENGIGDGVVNINVVKEIG